jgi:hypothetical protein
LLEKAERSARRALERLGEAIEKKIPASGPEDPLDVEELIQRLQEAIDQNVRQDETTSRIVAPNRLSVLLTYEERGRLGNRQIEDLSRKLETAARDFIANRRYQTAGTVKLDVGCDFLAKATLVKASFEAGADETVLDHGPARVIELESSDGRTFRIELAADGLPAYLGRAAGNAVHLDDHSVSRFHCSLSLGPQDEILIADLGSSNGTWVNNEIVSTGEVRVVEPGDEVGVGDVRLRLRVLPG